MIYLLTKNANTYKGNTQYEKKNNYKYIKIGENKT